MDLLGPAGIGSDCKLRVSAFLRVGLQPDKRRENVGGAGARAFFFFFFSVKNMSVLSYEMEIAPWAHLEGSYWKQIRWQI